MKETLEKRKPYWDLVDKKAEENNSIDLDVYAKGVQDGAKYMQDKMFSEEDMQKQMYREEEVENIIYELFEDYASNYTNKALEEFENFKKK
jgi:hypothetical protein